MALCHLLLLLQGGKCLFLFDIELELGRLVVFLGDRHRRILFNFVALLGALLRLLRQLGQAFGIKSILGIKEFDRCLIKTGQADRFKFQAIFQQILGDGILHCLNEIGALIEQLVHAHRNRRGAQRIDELVFDQLLQRIGRHGSLPQRLRCIGNAFRTGDDTHEKGGDGVDTQTIERNQAVRSGAGRFELEGIHIDVHDLMEDRKHNGATVHDDLLPAQPRPHKSQLLRSALIKTRKH